MRYGSSLITKKKSNISPCKKKYGSGSRLKKGKPRRCSYTQSGGRTFRQQAEKTHKCGSIYSDVLLWPFNTFKQFLRKIGVTSYIEGVARENRDYILLFHIVMFLVVLGLSYFILRMIFGGSLGLDISYISNFLKTMDSFDLPMSEAVNATAEREALNCWNSYFSSSPFNFHNSGLFDIVRSAVLLPFLAIFLYPILPILIIIYVIWFIWHFIGYIIAAIVGMVKAMLWFITEYIICEVSDPIPLFSYSCPDIEETFTGWREEYIDEPAYKERLKYLKVWYRNKWNYWDRAMLYLGNFWRRGGVQNKYNGKFLTRSKEVFYEKALDLNAEIDQKMNKVEDVASKVVDSVRFSLPDSSSMPDLQINHKKMSDGVVKAYQSRHIVYSFLSLVTLLTLVTILISYGLTGKPTSIFEFLGPLWRSNDLGNRLQLLSSRYNWLGIIGITLLLIYLIVPL